jgi:Transglycosylase-like domain
MRNKLIASAVPALLAVTLVAATQSNAVAGQPHDQANEARLHKHTKRPSAVSNTLSKNIAKAYFTNYVNAVNAAQTQQYLGSVADVDAYLHAVEAASHHPATRATRRSSGGAAPAGNGDGGFLACTRNRESHGNYGAVSKNGTYRGAYQFHQNTWDNTARKAGRGDLVGQDPAGASPANQDALAASLHASQGSAPWGGRCG